jgi:hypothetical protein
MSNQVPPVVKLFFPCEEAVFDQDAVAYRLLAPFHTIIMPPGVHEKYECERFDCYAQLSDALGTFRFAVQILAGDVDVVVYESAPLPMSFSPRSRLGIFDVVFQLRRVRFRRPGFYRLRLLCNHMPLQDGEMWLRVLGGV